MRKPRVLLDCDGVICDFLTPAFTILNRLSGLSHQVSELTEWDIFSLYPREHEDAFYEEVTQPGFCVGLPILDGAQEFVERLHDVAEVFVVTANLNAKTKGPRPPWHQTWAHERDHWLQQHFNIQTDHIVHTSAKYLCVGDVLIDDRPSNIESWESAHWPKGRGLLWDTPYNRADRKLLRVQTANQALIHIKTIYLPV